MQHKSCAVYISLEVKLNAGKAHFTYANLLKNKSEIYIYFGLI